MSSARGRRGSIHRTPAAAVTASARQESILAMLIVIALIVIAANSGLRTSTPSSTRTVSVASGQTLWGLAISHPVEGLTTAQTVELIGEMNGLQGGAVAVGQQLTIPEPVDHDSLAMR